MKLFAPVAGVFFLSLVGLLFMWVGWQDESRTQIALVQKQLTVLESFWNKRSSVRDGKIHLGYQDISAAGFPFSMQVRLLKPYVRDVRTGYRFTLTTSYIDLVPQDEENNKYLLQYPADAHAVFQSEKMQKLYYLHLSKTPNLMVQKVSVGNKTPSAINQYGIQFPAQMVFTADYNNKTQRYGLTPMATDELMWRPIFSNLRERVDYVRQLLAHGEQAAK